MNSSLEGNGLSGDHNQARQAWRTYWETTALLKNRLETSLKAEFDLTLTDYNLLLLLIEAGGEMRMGEIAERLIFVPSRATYRVKVLSSRGLVRRTPSGEDGRGALAAVTEAGRALFRAAAGGHAAQVDELFLGQLTTDEAATLLAIFSRVRSRLESGDRLDAAPEELSSVKATPERC